jgi:cytochrome P450
MNKNKCIFQSTTEPKGPKGIPFLNSFPFIAWDQLAFFSYLRDKFGGIAKYKMFGITCYLVSHPNDIAKVFKAEKKGIIGKDFFHKAIYEYFGNGLLNSSGKIWEIQRKRLQPYFKKSEKPKWHPIIVEETLSYLRTIQGTDQINAKNIIVPLTQSILSRILFGVKPDNESSKKLVTAIDIVSDKLLDHSFKSCIFNGFLNKLPTHGNLEYMNALKTIDQSIQQMSVYDETKKSDGLLHKLSKIMSPKELRDEIFTLFYAGQDTTANTILWTIYFLAKYPETQNKARKEIEAIWPNTNLITMEGIEKMEYLIAVIDESMRLCPSAYATYRNVKEDAQIGSYQLKKNALMILSPYVTHRHPRLWDKPNEFKPERFLNRKKHGLSFYPFGGGSRVCLGSHLAKLEITIIVALFVVSFDFTLNSVKIKKEVQATMKPKDGIPLSLKSSGYLLDKQ